MSMFTAEDRACYTRTYLIPAEQAGANDVHIIAEVKDKNPHPQDGFYDGFYTVDLFLEAEDYGMRTHIIGFPFGAGQMRKEQIDAVADNRVQSLIEDGLRGIVQDYLKENAAIEEMYARQDGGEQK